MLLLKWKKAEIQPDIKKRMRKYPFQVASVQLSHKEAKIEINLI